MANIFPTGTFSNTVVTPMIFQHDSVDVGYIEKGAKFSYKPTLLKCEVGVPAINVGQDIIKVEMTATVPMLEFTAETMAISTGGRTIHTVAGSEVTTRWSTPHNLTVAASPVSPGARWVVLDGPTINSTDKPVIKDVTGVTIYTEDTDYFVDYTKGVLWIINPALVAGTILLCKYKYTPPASKDIWLGEAFDLQQKAITFQGYRRTGKTISWSMNLAQVEGGVDIDFDNGKYIVQNTVFNGLFDVTNSSWPLAKISFQV